MPRLPKGSVKFCLISLSIFDLVNLSFNFMLPRLLAFSAILFRISPKPRSLLVWPQTFPLTTVIIFFIEFFLPVCICMYVFLYWLLQASCSFEDSRPAWFLISIWLISGLVVGIELINLTLSTFFWVELEMMPTVSASARRVSLDLLDLLVIVLVWALDFCNLVVEVFWAISSPLVMPPVFKKLLLESWPLLGDGRAWDLDTLLMLGCLDLFCSLFWRFFTFRYFRLLSQPCGEDDRPDFRSLLVLLWELPLSWRFLLDSKIKFSESELAIECSLWLKEDYLIEACDDLISYFL